MPGNFSDYLHENLAFVLEKSEKLKKMNVTSYVFNSELCAVKREKLMKYVKNIGFQLSASFEIVLQACVYVDLFLARKPVSNNNILSLIAFVSLKLAIQYHETKAITPEVLRQNLDNLFSAEAIVSLEIIILNAINFKLDVSNPIEIINLLIEVSCGTNINEVIVKHSKYFAFLAYTQSNFTEFGNSVLAIASISTALEFCRLSDFKKQWLEWVLTTIEVDISAVENVSGQLLTNFITSNIGDEINSLR